MACWVWEVSRAGSEGREWLLRDLSASFVRGSFGEEAEILFYWGRATGEGCITGRVIETG